MKHLFFIVLINIALTLVICSCKKKVGETIPDPPAPPDTIKPHSYFPVYPGSYWKYLKNDSITYTDTTSSHYVLCNFPTPGSYEEQTNLVYAPYYNGVAVFGYQNLACPHSPFHGGCDRVVFLSEKAGTTWSETPWSDPRYDPPITTEAKTVITKSLKNNDSVLIIKSYFTYINIYKYHPQPSAHLIAFREYTKNIGLTFHYILDTLAHDTVYKIRLLNYHIGK